jgi:hypothetical protein
MPTVRAWMPLRGQGKNPELKRHAFAFTGRIVLLVGLAVLLSGCVATPSSGLIYPFIVVFVFVAELIERIVNLIRAAFSMRWEEFYQTIRTGTLRLITNVRGTLSHLSWSDSYRIVIKLFKMLGIAIGALWLYVLLLVIFVLLEIPFWIAAGIYVTYLTVSKAIQPRSKAGPEDSQAIAEARVWVIILALALVWSVITVLAFVRSTLVQPATSLFGCLGLLVLVITIRTRTRERRREWEEGIWLEGGQ